MAKDTSELKLNKEQTEAINFGNGPLLIIAGAGTGKTTVITERIKHLIIDKEVKPEAVLALTFTEKAAREMEERVDVALPYGYTQMWISTFHSFCDRILRNEALHIGLDPRYKLMTGAEAVQLVRSNIFSFDLAYFRPLGNPTKFVDGMLQHFSRLQDEDISPQDYMRWVEKQKGDPTSPSPPAGRAGLRGAEDRKLELDKWSELARAYRQYDELKVKNSLLDFGDLITKTLKLFRDRPNVLRSYQEQFKYVLVDEFQDTNYAQNELAILLAGKKQNITATGDDNQSIYRFRGAAVSNILQFKKRYPKAKIISLVKNYRSTQTILDSAYQLIKFNDPDTLEAQLGIGKKLISQNKVKEQAEISFIHTDRVENEAEEVAKKVKELVANPPPHKASEGFARFDFKDIAILVRANNHAEPFIRALSRHGIPYQFLGPGRLFRQPEVVDLISYLKVLYNFEDSVALCRILSMDYFGIPPMEIVRIGNYARKNNASFFEAAEKMGEGLPAGRQVKEILEIIKKHLGMTRKETAGQLLYYFLADTGLLQKMLSPESPEAERRAANISKFFDKLKTYEVDHEDATVPAVVDWLELCTELGESPAASDSDWTDINAVNLLTVHSSKGLEFPVVFLVNLVGQRFPTNERREQIPIPTQLIKEVLPIGDYHLEEERRLFYVGMTRAKDALFFTAADYYGEGKREKRFSPFIFEALGEKAADGSQTTDYSKQLSFLDYSPAVDRSPSAVDRQPLRIDYLSYSQIETFRTCPLHYKLKYIYKVPTPQTPSQSFGSSMHATLKEFYLSVKNGARPSEKLILDLFANSWIGEGYLSRAQENKFLEKGKDYLRGFLKEEFNPKILPIVLEQPFTVPLAKDLKIGGKIDRVDPLPGEGIEIIDYKTGATIPAQSEVDKNLQLSFYALAATTIPMEPFGISPDKIKLSLYFLDNQEKISTTRTAKQLEEAKEEIIKVRDEIEKSDFTCSGHMFCQGTCEYSLFCRADK